MSNIMMSGRIYNAMMKFAGGTKFAPQFANLFYHNGCVYGTDSFAIVRWTPVEKDDGAEGFFFSVINKPAAGKIIALVDEYIDIDVESKIPESIDNVFDKHNFSAAHTADRTPGINPAYLAAISALGKAVKTDKHGADGTVVLGWENDTLVATIPAGSNGRFDIVVAPCFIKNFS